MKCHWCDEEIEDGERCGHVEGGDFHHECATRMIAGSAGHLLGMCSCFGGTIEDPPGKTKREAAHIAMRVAMMRKGRTLPGPVAAAVVMQFFPSMLAMEALLAMKDLGPVEIGAPRPGVGARLRETLNAMPSITCPKCKRTSYNPSDIAEKYCGACHEFHDEMNYERLMGLLTEEARDE